MMSLLIYREVLRPRWSPQYRAEPITQPRDAWMGVFSGDERVGYVHARQAPKVKDDRRGTQFRLEASLDLPLFGKLADLRIDGEGFRDNAGKHTDFDFAMRSAGQEFRAEGTLENGKLDARLHVADSVTPFKYDLGDQVLFASGAAGFDLPPLHPGEEMYMDAFNPMTMKLDKARITCDRQETIKINGEDVVANVLETSLGAVKTQAWVSDSQEVLRVVTPFGFTLQKVSPDEIFHRSQPVKEAAAEHSAPKMAKAAAEAAKPDMVQRMAIHVEGDLPARGTEHLRIRLGGVAEEVMPPSEPLQQRTGDVYDLRAATPPADNDRDTLDDAARAENLASDAMVNAQHPEIQKAAADITAGASTDWDKANKIYSWVYTTLEKTSVLSIPAALDVLHQKQGDCNEHTVLFVALARAAGIPSRIAVGLVYSDEVGGFGYHAWPEVFVGKWIPMDPTLGQPIADATHLKITNGGLGQWGRLMGYIGQAKIEVLGVE